MIYRVEHSLPDNPFYNTVKGSGDCQCNWGNFIDLPTLKYYSPILASGNVEMIDNISRVEHGYGWYGKPPKPVNENQMTMFDVDLDNLAIRREGELTSPFLCQGCSRGAKPKPTSEQIEMVMEQRGLFDE